MELTWSTNIDFALNSTPRPNTEKVIKVFHPTSKSAAAAFVAESAIKEPQDVFLKPLNRSFRPFSASQNEPQPASNDVTMFSPTWVFLHKRFFSTFWDFFRVCSSEIDSFRFFETFQSFLRNRRKLKLFDFFFVTWNSTSKSFNQNCLSTWNLSCFQSGMRKAKSLGKKTQP